MRSAVLFFLISILLFTQPHDVLGVNSTVRNRIEARKEIREQKKEEFRQRLQEIKDARKHKIVENLDASYARINNRWTTHFKNVLERLTKILDKIKARAEKENNTQALEAVNSAYTQIKTAQTAVEEQAAKTYAIQITTEDKLKDAAKPVHAQLRQDLFTLREQIKKVRKAIHDIVQMLK